MKTTLHDCQKEIPAPLMALPMKPFDKEPDALCDFGLYQYAQELWIDLQSSNYSFKKDFPEPSNSWPRPKLIKQVNRIMLALTECHSQYSIINEVQNLNYHPMRKLASIRTVKELRPIEGADKIELAVVDGWQCVVKKGEFASGDLGVYFEIDSLLPLAPEFEFLRKGGVKRMGDTEGYRIRTMKLRGQLSQGLLLPLSLWPHLEGAQPGKDVTDSLGVLKYEPPISANLAGEVVGGFPAFIPKTEQERIQNVWDEYRDKYRDVEFEVSVKMDGASMTAFLYDNEFGVCSRNWQLKESEQNSFWQIARAQQLEEALRKFRSNLALQGELVGPGIQGNAERMDKPAFYLFDIYDIDNGRYLSPEERFGIHEQLNGLGFRSLLHVPVPQRTKIFQCYHSLEELLAAADGPGYASPRREGIVCKGQTADGERVSFKVISNEYLLKQK